MRLPQRLRREDGAVRHAGFEFEFAGLKPREACKAVQMVFGGDVREVNPFSLVVEGAQYGDVGVELDAAVLKKRRYLEALGGLGVELDADALGSFEDMLMHVSATLVPCEVVLPPIPLNELDIVETFRDELRKRRAKGTGASLAYAFGMHINVEPPALDALTLSAYLKAFLLLHDYLREVSEVDFARAVSPYIDKYPSEFFRLVATPSYAPREVWMLLADYMRYNPTRNRSLDMLPLFAHLDEDAVQKRVVPQEAELISARPAFHYRLPNCRIDEREWTVESEWRQWLLVEELAADRERLEAMGTDYLDSPGFPKQLFADSWAERTKRWLNG